MVEQQDPSVPQRFAVHMTSDSHFSWLRTRLSIERTLMAWVRTATALIGFGFTIVQFFERFSQMQDVAAAAHPDAPRYLGLSLIGAGVIGLVVSLGQYRYVVRYLWRQPFGALAGVHEDRALTFPSAAVAIVVLLIGVFAFGAVAFRYV
jgi:putative membrane protein